MLRTPLVCRVLGRRLVTVYAIGRKSGRHYTTPVAYTWHDGKVLICTSFAWGRNLRTGEPVDIRLLGKRRTADVHVVTDEAGVVELYGGMTRGNHTFAQFNNIKLSQDGTPDASDLHLAWAAGARAFLLTLR